MGILFLNKSTDTLTLELGDHPRLIIAWPRIPSRSTGRGLIPSGPATHEASL